MHLKKCSQWHNVNVWYCDKKHCSWRSIISQRVYFINSLVVVTSCLKQQPAASVSCEIQPSLFVLSHISVHNIWRTFPARRVRDHMIHRGRRQHACPLKTCSMLTWNTSFCLPPVPAVFLSTCVSHHVTRTCKTFVSVLMNKRYDKNVCRLCAQLDVDGACSLWLVMVTPCRNSSKGRQPVYGSAGLNNSVIKNTIWFHAGRVFHTAAEKEVFYLTTWVSVKQQPSEIRLKAHAKCQNL